MDWSMAYLITGVVAAVVSTAVGLLILARELNGLRRGKREKAGELEAGKEPLMVQRPSGPDSVPDDGLPTKVFPEEVSSGKEPLQNG